MTLIGSGAVSVLAITSNGKIGLGLVALVFIGFALVSSFVLPRRNPDFPGNRLGLYITVAALLFIAMLASVIVFAKESEEAEGAGSGEESALTDTGTATETGTETETETETETGGGSGAAGDPAAGKAVFASAGCGGCHTLEAAGAGGNVGPNLDEAKPPLELAVDRVTNGMGVMPSFKDQLNAKQIHDVAAYVVQSTSG